MYTPVKRQPNVVNPFSGSLKRRIGSPLYTSYMNDVNKVREQKERCRIDANSNESKIFGNVFYINILRKEFAHEKLRNAIISITQSKYYKHELKKRTKELQYKIAMWDGDIARSISTEHLVDIYDGVTEYGSEQLNYLWSPCYYSVMQVLTKNGCKDSPIMASLECALTIYEYANKSILNDIAKTESKSPDVALLCAMYDEDIYKHAYSLRNVLAHILITDDKLIDLNADKNTSLAFNNILKTMGNFTRMRDIIENYFHSLKEQ